MAKERELVDVVCASCSKDFQVQRRSVHPENYCRSCHASAVNEKHNRVHDAPRWFVRRWYDIQRRCFDKDNSAYANYGGRGITCKFETCTEMWAYVSTLPDCSPELTIDRIDNDKSYEKGNLRWLPKGEQVHNRRVSDKKKAVARLLSTTSLSKQAVYKKLSNGMSEQDIKDEWSMYDRLSKSTSFSSRAIAQYLKLGMDETEIKEKSDSIERLLSSTTLTRAQILSRFSHGRSEENILSVFKSKEMK
ncbi:TPA: hypothetical protein NJ211_003812 [Vibrio parahaemolyticus]|uniref:hypothetical protein n=1 Tax=Vibrio alginolyticus TaxID=663 RepID=UPI002119FF08|nr:hypothetical protein [Vibrio alginolyticus]MCQ9070872.1 hypothetical protein [Vibrio alginolyticus]HCG6701229.1 hypothetical protein [Vibrio parahaemolyticus]HCG9568346.1 hypothetical protein [Vibrio parahaemolyticus]